MIKKIAVLGILTTTIVACTPYSTGVSPRFVNNALATNTGQVVVPNLVSPRSVAITQQRVAPQRVVRQQVVGVPVQTVQTVRHVPKVVSPGCQAPVWTKSGFGCTSAPAVQAVPAVVPSPVWSKSSH